MNNKKNNFIRITVIILAIIIIGAGYCFNQINANNYVFDNTLIKTLSINLPKEVYLGGQPIGISIDAKELSITGKCTILTNDGSICPVKDLEVEPGDILFSINNNKINSIIDIEKALESGNDLVLGIKRGKIVRFYTVQPALDKITNKYKIGLTLQNKICGIGTITYINPDKKEFGALGHPIKNSYGEDVINGIGEIYQANIIGYQKGQCGKAGELNGTFGDKELIIGSIDHTNEFGVFGKIDVDFSKLNKIEVCEKENVLPGKAQILTTIEGNCPQYYDIEIIKTYRQNVPKEKSMIIRITDKELLNKTGGIVQGMSGSPIIQNNKLVGAITHVFISDPSKGFGTYLEWVNYNK